MKIRKFIAASSREALKLVRQQLGGDAVILSNRSIPDGVEIVAVPSAVMNHLVSHAESVPDRSSASVAATRSARREVLTERREPSIESRAVAPSTVSGTWTEAMPAKQASRVPTIAAARGVGAPQPVMEEIRSMRSALEQGLARLAWHDMHRREPTRAKLLRILLDANFSAAVARMLTERLPADFSESEAIGWVKAVLAKNLRCLGDEASMIERGGVYALVGPTGVGKTTTTAKLAARCVVRHGADKVALLTTDGYRIGAQEQLRTYGKLLDVSVQAVRDAADLRVTLEDLSHKHIVLIDTVGMSHRDRHVAEQVAMLNRCQAIKRLLLINTTAHAETLEDVVEAYGSDSLAGCILSKVDEAAMLATSVDVAIRHKLNVYYIATGQRVPEDLHTVTPDFLVTQALRAKPRRAPFQLSEEELALTWAAAGAAGA